MSLHNRQSLEPWISDDIQFFEHQAQGVRRMANMKNVILADEMGLGKSLQALTVFALEIKRGNGDKLLIVCPASLKMNWEEEVQKFMGPSVHCVMLGSKMSPTKRKEAIQQFNAVKSPKILIVNYEQIRTHVGEINRCLFHMVIFDEAHMLKNMRAKRTEAAHMVVAYRKFMLTGSPILNHADDIYSLAKLAEMHGRMGPESPLESFYGFVNRYCVFGGYGNKSIVNTKNESELISRLEEFMVRRKKSEVLDLPSVQYIRRHVEMHPLQKKYYDQIVQEMKYESPDGEEYIVKNALTKFLRLKQVSGTTACVPGETRDVSHKLDQAVEDAFEIMENGHRVVVFTQFRGVQAAFAQRCATYKMQGMGASAPGSSGERPPIYLLHGDVPAEDRQKIIRAWSLSNRPGVLVAMFQVAGVGLNMTAARHGLFLDKQFVPALNQQAVDRMHRIGQDKSQPVQIIDYLVKGSVEARVEKILTLKSRVFNNLVENDSFLRQLLQELLEDVRNGKA